jgi:hypothetical protein
MSQPKSKACRQSVQFRARAEAFGAQGQDAGAGRRRGQDAAGRD